MAQSVRKVGNDIDICLNYLSQVLQMLPGCWSRDVQDDPTIILLNILDKGLKMHQCSQKLQIFCDPLTGDHAGGLQKIDDAIGCDIQA